MHCKEIRRNGMISSSDCKKIVLSVLSTIGFLAFSNFAVFATDVSNTKVYGVAIKGYDTVAYFTDGLAIKGKSEYSYNWNDASWHFSKPENRDLFAANPERYAPQFRGHCAYGLAKGKLVAADPEEWTIVDGKLYMNYNRSFRDSWRQDKTAMIKKAEANWAEIHN